MAALLARDGFTANGGAFEHPHGFFEVFNGGETFDAARIFENWADPLEVADPGPGLKQFPCCGSTHPAINCMLRLVRDEGLKPEDAAKIEILTNPRRLPHTDNPDPKSGLEAKFSIQYAVARALTDGRVGFEHFEGDAFADPGPRALMALMTTGEHPDMPADSPQQFAAEVIVTAKGGTRLSARQDHEIGRGPANPMSGDELWQKFRDCAGRALPEERIGPLFEMLGQFETLASLAELTAAMEFEGAGLAQRAGQ